MAVAVAFAAACRAQQSGAPADRQSSPPPGEPKDPVLTHRPPPGAAKQSSAVAAEGRIRLDLVVTDAAGKPVTGLEPWDFKLLDQNQSRKILSFRFFDGSAVKPSPPVQVILVIDTANLPFQQVSFVRAQVRSFLLQNGGHLQQPTSLFLFSDAGLRVQPAPSEDGNAMVAMLDQVKGGVRIISSAMGGEGLLERFQRSVRQLTSIAENEAAKPGRKLLVWIGPGWPVLNGPDYHFTLKDQNRFFDLLVELSTRLREARIVLYDVEPTDPKSEANPMIYQSFLKGVASPKLAGPGNLALQVLATQTGGRVLGPDNDVTGLLAQSVEDANAFYSISFDPLKAEHTDEYHELKVEVNQPGLSVRTSAGYYDQP